MQPTPLSLAEQLSAVQVYAGLVLLGVVLAYLHGTGRLRQAFRFPPAVPNDLTGGHLVLILAAFFGVTFLISLTLQAVGLSPPTKTAGVTATQTAPAQTQLAPAEPDEVESGEPESDEDLLAPATQQAAESQAAASQSDSGPSLNPESPSPENEMFSLVVQAVTEAVLIVVMLSAARGLFAGGRAGLGLGTRHFGYYLFWAIVGYLAFWPICVLLAESTTVLLELLAPSYKPPEHKVLVFLKEPGISLLWNTLAWILAGVVAPFFEEVFFRGLLLSWLRKTSGSTWLAIVFTGLAFGIIHAPQWHLVPALTALGLVLGYLYARTGSLTLVILFHAVFNLRTLILTALPGGESV